MNYKPSTKEKDKVVRTPSWLANHIYKTDFKTKQFKNVLDVGAWDGSLSSPFKKNKYCKVIGLDIVDEFQNNFDNFIHKDFLETTKEDFKHLKIDLIVSNPPFGVNENNELYPHLFLNHMFKLFGDTPIMLIAGDWYIRNSKKRMEEFNNYNLTKIANLHKTVFSESGVNVNSVLLYFNIKSKTPNEFITEPKKKEKSPQKTKTIAFNLKQEEYIRNNFINFSGEIKELIKEKYSDFPD